MEHWSEEAIGRKLLEKKVITEFQFQDAMKIQQESGKKFTRIILEKEFTTPIKINSVLAFLACKDLDSYIPDQVLLEKFKEEQVRKHVVMPLFMLGNKAYVSMANPNDFEAQEMIAFSCGTNQIRNIEGSPEEIQKLIDKYFGRLGAIMEAIKEVNSRKKPDPMDDRKLTASGFTQSEAPIVKLVDDYIQRALEENASDIHFEPHDDGLRIRMRIDGHLHTIETIPSSLTGTVTSRIKIISQMKIDIRMIPQDGRFSKVVNDMDVDFRVSSFPGIFGESLVLRILKRRLRILLDDLGLSPSMLERFRQGLQSDRGIFLVTGPTGCGKTTTLVSILSEIRDPTKKIVTLENPVEYQIDGAVQGQIHPQAGFTWATGLRAILRHDPNIIMVAEIRDTETASIAIEAGLTGHFVLSTLHTNNAPGTIVRLLEMGVEPFLISSSLIGVLAQRLVRTVCSNCRVEYEPPVSLFENMGIRFRSESMKMYRGTGCKLCRHTGYRGRTGIFELMLLTDKMRSMILERVNTSMIEAEARKSGMHTLRQDGIRKALKGLTTLEEIMSATQEHSTD